MKRRKRRNYEVSKRCSCSDRQRCSHDWWLRVYAHGKRQRINLTKQFPSDSLEVAAAKAKELAQKGIAVAAPVRTFKDVAEHYAASRPKKNYYVEPLVKLLGDRQVEDVTAADIKSVVTAWEKRPRSGPVAIRKVLGTLKHIFNWAIEEGYCTRTPFKTVQGVPLIHIKKTAGRTRRLEAGEADRILAVADDYIRDFFTAMVETGCRPGELRLLQWQDVHDDYLEVVAVKAKTRSEEDSDYADTREDS